MKRRDFIIGCSAGIALMAAPKLSLFANGNQAASNDQIFVVVFLRGGCDGLQMVAPVSESIYQDARPGELKVGEKGKEPGLRLKNALGEVDFRLHPNAAELHELYQSGDLAILQACGLKNGTRSHFEAMDLIERGLDSKGSHYEGWMARYLNHIAPEGRLPAVATSGGLPQALNGYGNAASITNLKEYDLPEYFRYPDLLRSWYTSESHLDQSARQTLDTIAHLSKLQHKPSKAAKYPKEWYTHELSESFKTLGQLIKNEVGIKLAMVDYGGWDTHEHQGAHFPRLTAGLSKSLAAFYRDIDGYKDRVTILVMSEFGRRLKANRSQGTDHGYGNMMMALGAKVKGGQMYGTWPGLDAQNLDKGVDLDITTDYRAVLGEILQSRMQVKTLSNIFPGFSSTKPLGFLE